MRAEFLFVRLPFATRPSPPVWLATADLNADGKLDLVSANDIGRHLTVLINTTVFPTKPPLYIAPAGNQVALFWPVSARNHVLQSTTMLSVPDWTAVTNGSPIVGVTLTNTPSTRFFRLTK